jgi:hypothetical protein
VKSTVATRRAFAARLSALALAAAAAASLAALPLPAAAHETDCPFCKLKVVQDTKEQDNEVALRYGRKRIEYRCVFCALSEAQTPQYPGDLTILAPSEKKGQPVVIERRGGAWSAPDGTLFVGVRASHDHCQVTYRAFTSRAAFDAHVAKNPVLLRDAKPLTLAQMVELAKPKQPK